MDLSFLYLSDPEEFEATARAKVPTMIMAQSKLFLISCVLMITKQCARGFQIQRIIGPMLLPRV